MSWTRQQHVFGTKGSGGNPVATLASTTAGNLLVATIGGSAVGGVATAFTMPAGWTLINSGNVFSQTSSTVHSIIGFAYYANNPGSITSVTATWDVNGGNVSGWIHLSEWTGEFTGGDPFDITAGIVSAGTNGAAAATGTSLVPTGNNELFIAGFTSNESGSADWGTDVGWTQDDVFHFVGWNTAAVVQHLPGSGNSSQTASINSPTNAATSIMAIVAFKANSVLQSITVASSGTPKLTPLVTFALLIAGTGAVLLTPLATLVLAVIGTGTAAVQRIMELTKSIVGTGATNFSRTFDRIQAVVGSGVARIIQTGIQKIVRVVGSGAEAMTMLRTLHKAFTLAPGGTIAFSRKMELVKHVTGVGLVAFTKVITLLMVFVLTGQGSVHFSADLASGAAFLFARRIIRRAITVASTQTLSLAKAKSNLALAHPTVFHIISTVGTKFRIKSGQ